MRKKTIAENHLSKHGRGGDTEIIRTSNNELWHVNKHEKAIIDAYGVDGEKYVQKIGSNTINPITGLKEQIEPVSMTIAGAVALAGLVIGTVGGSFENRAKEKAAELEKLTESGRKAHQGIVAKFQQKLNNFTDSFGMKKANVREGKDQIMKKSGFAQQQTGDPSLSAVNKGVESGLNELEMGMGQAIGQNQARIDSETARLKATIADFQHKKDLAEEQSSGWYLGKGVMHAGAWAKEKIT